MSNPLAIGRSSAARRLPNSPRCHVLFDCPAARPLFDTESTAGIGGAEVRAVTFARQLAERRDFEVHFVVADGPTLPPRASENITLHRERIGQHRPVEFWPRIWQQASDVSARWTDSLAKRFAGRPPRRPFFETAAYDVLLTFGVTNRTAALVRSARRAGRRCVVFLTTDRTLDDVCRRGRRDRGVYGELGELCRYALTQADAVIAQKASQQQALRARLGLDTQLIRNPICLQPLTDADSWVLSDPVANCIRHAPYVLWVGRADTFSKRADLAIEAARRCPHRRFVLIMNRHDDLVFQQLIQQLPDNVQVIERVPFAQIEHLYRHATLLLNTSDAEGFPNSFLQAGKYGVPVVSLRVDPDEMLTRNGVGVCAHGDITELVRAVDRLMSDSPEYVAMSARIRAYVGTSHAAEVCGQQLAELIRGGLRHYPAA